MLWVDIFERDGEVDEEQVEVINPPVTELHLRRCFRLIDSEKVKRSNSQFPETKIRITEHTNVVMRVVRIPQLSMNPNMRIRVHSLDVSTHLRRDD